MNGSESDFWAIFLLRARYILYTPDRNDAAETLAASAIDAIAAGAFAEPEPFVAQAYSAPGHEPLIFSSVIDLWPMQNGMRLPPGIGKPSSAMCAGSSAS